MAIKGNEREIKKVVAQKPMDRHDKKLFIVIPMLAIGGLLIIPLLPVKPVSSFSTTQSNGEVKVISPQNEILEKPMRGAEITPGSVIKTGAEGEIDIEIPGQVKLRVKENSEVVIGKTYFYEKQPPLRVVIESGRILATREKDSTLKNLELKTNSLAARFVNDSQGSAALNVEATDDASKVSVIRGQAEVQKAGFLSSSKILLSPLEKVESKKGQKTAESQKISRDEWDKMKEIYELTQKSAAQEAKQLDLAKKAGSFFEYVFDHGSFYTPKFGYCERQFFLQEDGETSYAQIEYDVFPPGSYAGIYVKTRDLDAAKFSAFELEIRKVEGEGFPMNVRVELKSKSGLVRAFALKNPGEGWEKRTFPLLFKKETLLTEVTVVFHNTMVGENKKGMIEFRNINLIPKTVEELEKMKAIVSAGKNPTAALPSIKAETKTQEISTGDSSVSKPAVAAPEYVPAIKKITLESIPEKEVAEKKEQVNES